MPQTRSMKKSLRQSLERRDRNRLMKVKVKSTRRALLDNLPSATVEENVARLIEAQKALDKAAKRGVLHANAAARRKSKLASKIAALKTQ